MLDVSFLTVDLDLADKFTVKRRTETVDQNGRSQVSTRIFKNVVGVVTAGSSNDLDRRDDFQVMTRSLNIVTRFKLRGESTGVQPDLIIWNGNSFVVKHLDLYPQSGSGFYQAECSSIDLVDEAIK